MRNQFQLTIAIVIGLVAHTVWWQTLFLKDFGNQRRCMAFSTFGSLEIEIALYISVVTGVPSYGRDITKVEYTNHAVKCYRNRLETLCNDKPDYHGCYQDVQCQR